jgi:hypothetical protein
VGGYPSHNKIAMLYPFQSQTKGEVSKTLL